MAEHPIQGLMNVTMDKIRQMADSNTIIGKPIKTDDGTTILPVSRISFGFASAGTDFDGKNAANKDLFGGGSGAGVNIQPVAFLVIKDGCVRTIQLSDGANAAEQVLVGSILAVKVRACGCKAKADFGHRKDGGAVLGGDGLAHDGVGIHHLTDLVHRDVH